jgi:hypothetical protein
MQLKKIVLALGTAACLAQGAHAAISVGNPATNQPPGELFLTVYNPATTVTYTRDLGLDLDGFGSNAFSTNFNTVSVNLAADAAFASAFPSTAGLVYSVIGVNFYDNPASPNAGYNVFTTSNASQAAVLGLDTLGQIPLIHANVTQYVDATNSAAGNSNFTLDSVAQINGTASNGSFGGGIFTNGTLSGGLNGLSTAAAIGTPLSFYLLSVNLETGENVNSKFASSFLLDANGRLTYNAEPPVVPLPPAVWLLGSALAGLVGVARRRQQAAAV